MKFLQIPTLITISLICKLTFAQNYSITHFNEKNGFNASTIYGISQDSRGYLWIGSDIGLIRYDGISFKYYGLKDGVIDLDVFNLNIDSNDYVFLHNFSNQINYYKDDLFYNTKNHQQLSNLGYKNYPIGTFYEYENSFVISSFNANSFFIIKLSNDSIKSHKEIKFHKDHRIIGIITLKKKLYVFYRYNNGKAAYKVYNNSYEIGGDYLKNPANYFAKIEDYICIAQDKEIKFFKKEKNDLLKLYDQINLKSHIKSIFSNKNVLWVSLTKGGIVKIDLQKNIEYLNQLETVNYGYVDRDSNYWIATEGNGLYYYRKSLIKNYDINTLKVSKVVTSLFNGIDNSIYLGFNKAAIAKFKNDSVIRFHNLENKKKPDSRKIVKFLPNKDNSFVCLTEDYEYNLKEIDGKFYSSKLRPIFDGTNKDAIKLNNTDFLFATSSSLIKASNGNFIYLLPKRVTTIEADSENKIWIGTLNGLYTWSKSYSEPKKNEIEKLSKTKINDINFFRNNVVVSTDTGIFIYDDSLSEIKNIITEKNGLISNQCKKTKSHYNYLWILTNKGISKIEFEHQSLKVVNVTNYTTSDGLISNFVNDILIKNDTAWVATDEGLSVFPCNLKKKKLNPLINIIEASTNLSKINIFQPIKLSPTENNISITYSNMLFSKRQENTYEYRLLPENQEWVKTKETTLTFANLYPKKYKFEVRPLGKKKSAGIEFEILPKFTQTLLFKILLSLVFSVSLILFLLWRVKIIKRKNFIEKTISKLELEAIKAQINPHFIYNCLNSIKNTIINKERRDAENQLSLFSVLVRKTLEISQQNFISLDKEIDYLEKYIKMERLRFKEKLEYSINLQSISNTEKFNLPSMLIQPFVENAIKHGKPNRIEIPLKIKVIFKLIDSKLICEIHDNGIGINTKSKEKQKNHKSLGIKLCSKRAETYNELYGSKIKIKAAEKSTNGTIITIFIPQK